MRVNKQVDILIIGAGISGIDAAYRLQQRCPGKSCIILESRARIGGTWDLFRFPGVRSDSDMYTLGFPFRPWLSDQAIVGGEAIRQYVEDTAREFGIFERIRFNHQVTRASWSSADACWTVETDGDALLHGMALSVQVWPPSDETPRNASLLADPDEDDGATNAW